MDVMDIKGMKFQKVIFGETRVVLVSENYGAEHAEPVYGSDFECVGTIVGESDEEETPVAVNWDNGEGNLYRLEDLRAMVKTDDSNPNSSFRRKKSEDLKKKRRALHQDTKKKLTKTIKKFKLPTFEDDGLTAEDAEEVHRSFKKHVIGVKGDNKIWNPGGPVTKGTKVHEALDELDRYNEDEHDR